MTKGRSAVNIAVVPNFANKEAESLANDILSLLNRCECKKAELKPGFFDAHGLCAESLGDLDAFDLLIAVGGDGTIIHTAKAAAKHDKPILGVNAGKLGFTAGVEFDELHLLSKLIKGEYHEEKRLMLDITFLSNSEERRYCALNDAVVSAELAKIIDYRMALGENKGYRYRADGFIVATPTGSTAYSLSAGGPVVEPTMDCLIYTPICPHSLFNRSVIFGSQTELTVDIPENRSLLFLTVDGEPPVELHPGDKLIFSKSEHTARFIKLSDKNFYDTLNRKIIGAQ